MNAPIGGNDPGRGAATPQLPDQTGATMPDATAFDAAVPGAAVPGAVQMPAGQGELPPPEPLPYDGVTSVAVGTVLWAVVAVVLLFLLGDLRDDGRLWWLATAVCGFVLGVAGLWVVVRRRRRLNV